MKISNYLLILLGLSCASCGPRIASRIYEVHDPLDYREEVVVVENEASLPPDAIKIGRVRVGDNGFSKSNNYSDVINSAKEEARKNGGNLLHIVKHKHPDFWSTTHRITAYIYKTEEQASLEQREEKSAFLSDRVAIIHVYRTASFGTLVEYDLYLGEQLLCRVKNNWKMSVQITQDGLNTLWARSESKTEVPLKVELGKEYYVRCSVKMGVIKGRPKLELIDEKTGKMEFDSID